MALYQFVLSSDNKREKWKFMPTEEVEKLNPRPMFTTALKLTANPREVEASGSDPAEVVRYLGPMHFDLDNANDIPSALKSGRELLHKLVEELDVPVEYISIFLSGKKGLHFTIPETLFGIKRATKALPLIWKYVAESLKVDDLDMSIYSMRCGRMWRNANVQRKEGTYKVPVTAAELESMDEAQYLSLVAAPRVDLEAPTVPSDAISAKAARMVKDAGKHVKAILRKQREVMNTKLDNARDFPEVPGCIQKLITEGDCEESNYNQAAMQLASWIAARFDKSEEEHYTEVLINPFLENVTSSTRSSFQERERHVQEMLAMAYQGRLPFTRGAVISTIGEPCHKCPICRPDLLEGKKGEAEEGEHFDPVTRIAEKASGYVRITSTSLVNLTSFIFIPHTQYNQLRYTEEGVSETGRIGMIGTIRDDEGRVFNDIDVREEVWRSRNSFSGAVTQGLGTAIVLCTDADLSVVQRAVLKFYNLESLNMTTYTEACGFYLERLSSGDAKPHYVEAEQAVSQFGVPSRFRYQGSRSHVPDLLNTPTLCSEDTDAVDCLRNISRMNEQHSLAMIIGWLASNFFREHINFYTPEYPSINVCGNSGSGKSATTRLLCKLSGLDYNRAGCEPLNLEASTMVPLHRYMSNSNTVVRLVEEANEAQMKRGAWNGWVNVVKSAWDRTSVSRGTLGNARNPGVGQIDYRISAPLMFISEQKPTRPAVQERCISVLISKRGRKDKSCREAFLKAQELSDSLYKVGRKLLDISMVSDPSRFTKGALEATYGDIVPEDFDDRPRYSFMVVFLGLTMLHKAFEESGLPAGSAIVDQLSEALKDYLQANRKTLSAIKRQSECDLAMRQLNSIAADPESRNKLRPGIHYVRQEQDLKLNLDTVFNVYRRFCNEIGVSCVFQSADQFGELLQSEPYFDRMEPDEKTQTPLYVLNIPAAQERGVRLSSFIEVSGA